MSHWSRTPRWTVSLVLLLALPAAACDWPQAPFKARYAVSRDGKPLGVAEARLEILGPGRARYSMVTDAESGAAGFLGARVSESAELTLNDTGWRSLDYQYRQKVALSRRKRDIHFDWTERRAHGSGRGGDWTLALTGDESDRLTVNLILANRLRNGTASLTVTTVEDGERRIRSFRRRAADTTETPAGTYAAIPVERIHSNPKRTTVSWYAPALDYLPVRIEQHKPDGERITMALIEHQVLPCQPTEP